ncbi:hypothetical protein ON010_g14209 [Phytophthora cinnamomi]|nr:hypothetical protein ON010_g14209 [Phytophthora cinnamomi]
MTVTKVKATTEMKIKAPNAEERRNQGMDRRSSTEDLLPERAQCIPGRTSHDESTQAKADRRSAGSRGGPSPSHEPDGCDSRIDEAAEEREHRDRRIRREWAVWTEWGHD